MIGYVDISDATIVRETPTAILFRFGEQDIAYQHLWIPKSELRSSGDVDDLTYYAKMLWISQNNIWLIVKSNDPRQTNFTTAFNDGVVSWQCGTLHKNNPYLTRTIRHEWFEGWDTAECSNLLGKLLLTQIERDKNEMCIS